MPLRSSLRIAAMRMKRLAPLDDAGLGRWRIRLISVETTEHPELRVALRTDFLKDIAIDSRRFEA
jgi:hypothetical protein